MLEWMHDKSVVSDLRGNFAEKTLKDCLLFIEEAQKETTSDLHLAIVSEQDEYLGTVSLKHMEDGSAEFAIAIRTRAMGTGAASEAMKEIVRYGLDSCRLDEIYWCVDPNNKRALRFYDKNGYSRTEDDSIPQRGEYSQEEMKRYIWYRVERTR